MVKNTLTPRPTIPTHIIITFPAAKRKPFTLLFAYIAFEKGCLFVVKLVHIVAEVSGLYGTCQAKLFIAGAF
jgi:hypothetical protein